MGDANRTRSAPGQVAPDTAYLSTANPQRVGRQRRVGHLKKPTPRSQQLETGFDDGSLNLQREPFNRQARDNGGQPLGMAGEILADSCRIAVDITVAPGKSRRSTAAKRASCSTAMMRSSGQPARTCLRVRLPVPAPSSRTGPGLSSSTKRARASARWGPLGLAAAIRSGFCSQRPKKIAVSAAMPLSTPDRNQRIILAVVCYSFSNPTCGRPSQKRHRRMVLMHDRARGARCDGRENDAV